MKNSWVIILFIVLVVCCGLIVCAGAAGIIYYSSNQKVVNDKTGFEEHFWEYMDENNPEGDDVKNWDAYDGSMINQPPPTPPDLSILTNDDWFFSFGVIGDVSKYREVSNEYDWLVNSYAYCYDLGSSNKSNQSICNDGEVELFSINVYDAEQYEEAIAYPTWVGELLYNTDRMYFVFEHPNGDFPSDVPDIGQLYSMVKETFSFD